MSKSITKTEIVEGIKAGWPICLGYLPIGIAFGVLAQKAGLDLLEIGLMSVVVFAGSAQFIAVSMISAGAAALPIIITTFVVNLRHFLMSSSLAVFLGKSRRKKLALFAYGVTDESFAVNHPRFKQGRWGLAQALVVNHVSNFTWLISSLAGGYGGQFIPAHAFGIDYALIAMFISLLVIQIKGLLYVFTAVIAGITAVAISLIIPGNAYIVIASIIAATVGSIFRKRFKGKV